MAKLYNVTDKNREKHDQEARCNSCTSPLLYSQILVAFSETGFPAATGIRLIGKKLCCQDRASSVSYTHLDQICKDAKPTDNNGTISADEQPVMTSVTIID